MKFINAFAILLVSGLQTTSNRAVIDLPHNIYISTPYVGYFSTSSNLNVTITIHENYPGERLKLKYAYAHNDAVYAEEEYPLADYTEKVDDVNVATITVTIPCKNYLSSNGVKMSMEVFFRGIDPTYTNVVTFYPRDTTVINANKYTKTNYVVENRFFKINQSSNVTSETFNFSHMAASIHNNKYNYLNLNTSYFTISSKYKGKNPSKNKYLVIEDKNNIFPYITKSDGLIKIPLTLVKSGTKMYPRLITPLYVNPYTLQMSLTSRTGFVSTNNFYLPIFEGEKMESYKVYYSLNELGYSGINTKFTSSYLNDYQYFGSCDSSTYCIGGGVSK